MTLLRLRLLTAALMTSTLVLAAAQAADKPGKFRVYVGTYTGGGSEGIYLAELDAATGKLSAATLAGKATNPSFLAIHPTKKFLYSVGEVDSVDGQKGGGVSAFAIDPATGKLTLLNQQSSVGGGPCHLVVDQAGKNALVANYGGGSVACLPILADGKLEKASAFIQHKGSSVNKSRQESPHAHSINLDPANKFAFAADLGLDEVLIYKFDAAQGSLTPHGTAKVAPGAGPRHFAFHPSGKYAYVINEITLTVTGFTYDAAAGKLTEIQTITTLPEGFKGNGLSTAEIVAHPSGKFLYGSNRGHDSIAMFKVDEATGKLTALGHEPTGGKTPRNFAVDPTGGWLLAENQGSGTVVVFQIDAEKGTLKATGDKIEVANPVCIRFLPIE